MPQAVQVVLELQHLLLDHLLVMAEAQEAEQLELDLKHLVAQEAEAQEQIVQPLELQVLQTQGVAVVAVHSMILQILEMLLLVDQEL
jgi:hypothetical protein